MLRRSHETQHAVGPVALSLSSGLQSLQAGRRPGGSVNGDTLDGAKTSLVNERLARILVLLVFFLFSVACVHSHQSALSPAITFAKICEVHGVRLRRGYATYTYGYELVDLSRRTVAQRDFPNENRTIHLGGESRPPQRARARYCPKCRTAADEWSERYYGGAISM